MDIEAFILIGGRSSRFGSDKAFFEFEGETLATRTAKTIEAALSEPRITFVTAAEDQFPSELLFGLWRPVVSDVRPGFGAWSGLHAAAAYARSTWIFVTACDLPRLNVQFLRVMVAQVSDGIDAVVARQADDRLQPLCAVYRSAKVLPLLESYLDSGIALPALRIILREMSVRVVDPDEYSAGKGEPDPLCNLNSAANLAL